MKKYLLTRIAVALPVILLVSVLSFLLVFLAPGDPAAQYRTLEMTDEEYEQLKTELGYNDPVIVQYGRWLSRWCTAISACPPVAIRRSGRSSKQSYPRPSA
mgnify:CR=1 FL=1